LQKNSDVNVRQAKFSSFLPQGIFFKWNSPDKESYRLLQIHYDRARQLP
jgi:hypothetical protein